MNISHGLSILALAAALSACAGAPGETAAPPPPAQAGDGAAVASGSQDAAHAALWALFRTSDEDQLKRNPLSALARGDMRYADRLGNYLTDAYYAAEKAAAQSEVAALQAIDRSALNETDRLAYDVFEYEKTQAIEGLTDELIALQVVRPLNHFYGFHTSYPVLASGEGAAPFKTVEDYENNLKRHAQFVELMDRAVQRFREGMASGVVETRLTINNVIGQLDTQLAQDPKDSPYYAPALNFPDSFSEADKARLAAEYERVIRGDIFPAYRRLRDFLADEYVAQARDQVGLSAMKGGETLYKRLIEETTTLPLEPDYIHELGLSEVARIRGQMEAIKTEVGFEGTLADFFEFLRTDPQFKPKSVESFTQGFYDIGAKVDARIGEQFSTIPKSPLEIRRVEPFREAGEAAGSYNSGTPDGSRPGVFYFNAYDLDNRQTYGMETLYLHEGSPGHHFQISLAQENEALPSFMRFGGNTAFVEGWALYAETLGPELGLFTDPYQRFGHLNDEMLRAMRLVVDTGLHSKGWTRDQAIKYMLDNSGMPEVDAISEVERYIAIPSQAVSYKIGALKIQELKKKAMDALGDRFDPREFHAQVLMTGALPLPILERKIDDWIAQRTGG
ncbi:DUF885 domain-containing protein [Pacificimonas flava]|uniref:DUF885 domain-containing protein n=1 Tax=Pacificimonas flava TaxID=1234595 RepID=M2TLY1_9SPHN|nr:DUF885 domain-containing protein [Pacificimonas flava]EMD82741.1 hypothetical protein C725_1781 [Pacificimonas flava]MBB5279360.1 uncharacterized protein (DUF885 family) [Pacificimonas flava]